MEKIKTQFGRAMDADFEESSITFKMQEGFEIASGDFAILPKDAYQELIEAVKSIRNSVNVHPDCVENSEFKDMVGWCDEVLGSI